MGNDDGASQDASTGGQLKQNALLNAGDVWRGGTGRRPEGVRSWSSRFLSCQVFRRVWCLFDHFLNHPASTVVGDVWWWFHIKISSTVLTLPSLGLIFVLEQWDKRDILAQKLKDFILILEFLLKTGQYYCGWTVLEISIAAGTLSTHCSTNYKLWGRWQV